MKYNGGIDPGATGAVAFWCADLDLLEVHDMPTHEIKGKKVLDLYQLGNIVRKYAADTELMVIEKPNAMPGQGVSSMFKFGFACGAAETVTAANLIPSKLVVPAKWKRDMRLPKDKDAARQRASQLFPNHCHLWARKKDDGRAEAALLAWYGTQDL